jgi:hypothetical protein
LATEREIKIEFIVFIKLVFINKIGQKMTKDWILLLLIASTVAQLADQSDLEQASMANMSINEAYTGSQVLRFSSTNGWLQLIAWQPNPSTQDGQTSGACLTTF